MRYITATWIAWYLTVSCLQAEAAGCTFMLEEYIQKFDSVGLAKRLDVAKVNKYLRSLEREAGVTVTEIAKPFGRPVYQVRIAAVERPGAPQPMRVLLTAGVHGNEPIGVTSGLQVLEAFIASPRLRENFDLTFIMINPPALAKGTRRTPSKEPTWPKTWTESERESADADLNRNFLDKWPPEYDPIRVELQKQVFDIGLDLHGGPKRTSFFLIKGKSDGDFTARVLRALNDQPMLESRSGTYPGFVSVGANSRAYRMLSPGETISVNAGTLKTFVQDLPTWWSGTLEYPGKMDPFQAHEGLFRMAISVMWHARQEAPTLYRGLR